MENLIGDEIDRWPELVAEPAAHVHIYGKGEARPGRKMGHLTRVALRRFDHLDRHPELLQLRPDLGRIADHDPGKALRIEQRARRLVERSGGLRAIFGRSVS